MKKNLLTVFSISAIVLAFSVFSFAQENRTVSSGASKYVISAEAGGVNYIQGKVAVSRKFGRTGLLLKGDQVKIGDKVSTEVDGKAEILLNPGSYIRLGGNSSFEFVDTSLENLQIKLDRGSAIFEVITTNDFTFAVNTPKATFNVVQSGVYRVDVMNDGTGKIEVWKGKAQIGEDEDATVKKGRTATVGGDDVAVAKFDRDERDDLEQWSRDRAKELTKVNDRLERQNLRSTLISGFNSNRWNLYDSFGLWVYDPFWGGYCFLPFGYGWSSPYGFGYGRDIWGFRLPRYIFMQPPPPIMNNPNTGNTTNPNSTAKTPRARGNSENPNSTARTNRATRPEATQRITPPFQQVDQTNGRGGIRDTGSDTSDSFPSRSSSPRVLVPAPSSGNDVQRPGRP
jgi:hypothetical protein